MSMPSISMLPESTLSNPASMRRSVVLPHPDAPRRQNSSPLSMSSERSSTATTSPNRRVTLLILMNGDPVKAGQPVSGGYRQAGCPPL